MGWYLDGRVTAVVGTHTHVPTADARVLPGGTRLHHRRRHDRPARRRDRRQARSRRSSRCARRCPCASRPPTTTRGSWASSSAASSSRCGRTSIEQVLLPGSARRGAAGARRRRAERARSARAGRTTRCRGRTSTSTPSCSGDRARAAHSAASPTTSRAARDERRPPPRRSTARDLDERCCGQSASRRGPRPRTATPRRGLEADRAVLERAQGRRASSRTIDAGDGTKPAANAAARSAARRARGRAWRAAAPSASGANFVSPASAIERAARAGSRPRRAARRGRARATSASLAFAVRRVERERVRHPRVGEHDAQRRARGCAGRAGTAAPTQSRSKKTDAACAAGRSSQRPAPRPEPLERDVGDVVDRPVGVAVLVVARERRRRAGSPCDELVGADHARVADVDDVGVRRRSGRSRKPTRKSTADAPATRPGRAAAAARGAPARAAGRSTACAPSR